MIFKLHRVSSKCYMLFSHGDDIGCVFCHDFGPEPWVAMLYRNKFRHPVYFPRPFKDREHSFRSFGELRDWLHGFYQPPATAIRDL